MAFPRLWIRLPRILDDGLQQVCRVRKKKRGEIRMSSLCYCRGRRITTGEQKKRIYNFHSILISFLVSFDVSSSNGEAPRTFLYTYCSRDKPYIRMICGYGAHLLFVIRVVK